MRKKIRKRRTRYAVGYGRSPASSQFPPVRVAALSGPKLRRSRRTAVADGVTGTSLANFFAHLEHPLFNGAQATLARVASSQFRARALEAAGSGPRQWAAQQNAAAAVLPVWLSAGRFLGAIAREYKAHLAILSIPARNREPTALMSL